MFSDLQSLIYKDHDAYDTFFDNGGYVPDVTVIADNGLEITGYQELSTGHIISYDWDRLQVYGQDGGCVFSVIVEP